MLVLKSPGEVRYTRVVTLIEAVLLLFAALFALNVFLWLPPSLKIGVTALAGAVLLVRFVRRRLSAGSS